MTQLSTCIILGAFLMISLTFVQAVNNNIAHRPNFLGPPIRRAPQVHCTPDSLMIYQDCRMCVCPRPNKLAKCFKKSCDLRTKDSGQCPSAVLKMDDSKLCPVTPLPSCKADADCPGVQLCCFDFCAGAKCVNPLPLDSSSGFPVHLGRGYQ